MKPQYLTPVGVQTPNPYQVHDRPLDTIKTKSGGFYKKPLPFATLLKVQRELNVNTRSKGLFKCLCRAHGDAVIKSDGKSYRTENISVCKSGLCINCSIPKAKSMAEELGPVIEWCVVKNDYDAFMMSLTHSKSLSITKNYLATIALSLIHI